MLFSNQNNRFKSNFVITLLIIVTYAPHASSRNDPIVANAIEQSQNASNKKVPFVEYYIEHNVSQGDAKRSFFDVGVKLLDGAYFGGESGVWMSLQFNN